MWSNSLKTKYDGGLASKMTMRDKFACTYIQGVMADSEVMCPAGIDISEWYISLAYQGYEFADAMLVARADEIGEAIN